MNLEVNANRALSVNEQGAKTDLQRKRAGKWAQKEEQNGNEPTTYLSFIGRYDGNTGGAAFQIWVALHKGKEDFHHQLSLQSVEVAGPILCRAFSAFHIKESERAQTLQRTRLQNHPVRHAVHYNLCPSKACCKYRSVSLFQLRHSQWTSAALLRWSIYLHGRKVGNMEHLQDVLSFRGIERDQSQQILTFWVCHSRFVLSRTPGPSLRLPL